jgi:tetratricopeptide (TPR) repeat protein
MARTALDRAQRLFAAGRRAEVIALLEPQVPVYRDSPRFYYLLGASCLWANDLGGAYTYLMRAAQLSPGDPDIGLALAALDVRRGETEKAVVAYLRTLELRPGDRLATKALALLRREGSAERLAELTRSGRIASIYPGARRGSRLAVRLGLAAAVAALIATIAFLAGPSIIEAVSGLARPIGPRPEVAAVELDDEVLASPVTSGGSFRYVLTEKEALAGFERAKARFQEYRDNAALLEINRLLGSNASPALKDKARALKGFVGIPDFRTVRDAPPYAAAAAEPELYDGCAVVWKGMAANVAGEGGMVRFDFLVGYHEKKRLEGIVPASATGAAIPLDRPLEILAIIRAEQGRRFRLECVAIHEMGG